jgi:hypothetical protein
MIAVERADRPLPAGVGDDVAAAHHEILHNPWVEPPAAVMGIVGANR